MMEVINEKRWLMRKRKREVIGFPIELYLFEYLEVA